MHVFAWLKQHFAGWLCIVVQQMFTQVQYAAFFQLSPISVFPVHQYSGINGINEVPAFYTAILMSFWHGRRPLNYQDTLYDYCS